MTPLIVRRLYLSSIVVLMIAVLGSLPFERDLLSVSILIGGVLSLANINAMTRGFSRFLGPVDFTSRLMFHSIFRLMVLATIIIGLAYSRRVDLVGFLLGFTLVLFTLLFEGARYAREMGKKQNLKDSV
jgi:hypothetical protein